MQAETPQNGEYLVAAYVITAAILISYWGMLWKRATKVVSGDKQRKRGEC